MFSTLRETGLQVQTQQNSFPSASPSLCALGPLPLRLGDWNWPGEEAPSALESGDSCSPIQRSWAAAGKVGPSSAALAGALPLH